MIGSQGNQQRYEFVAQTDFLRNSHAALATLFPFIPMALTQLGLTPSEAALIYGSIPFLSAVARVLVGALADKLQAHKPLLMLFCIATGTINLGVLFIPPVRSVTCDVTTGSFQATICQTGTTSWAGCLADLAGWERDDAGELTLNSTEETATLSCSTGETSGCPEEVSFVLNLTQLRNPILGDDKRCRGPQGSSTQAKCVNLQWSDSVDGCLLASPNVNCSITMQNTCSEPRQRYDKTFWIALFVCLAGYVAFAPTCALMHAIAYAMLGEDRDRWGKQRYFGTLGFMVAAVAVGLSMQLTSDSDNTNVTGNFIGYFALQLMTAGFVFLYKQPSEVRSGSLFTNIKALARNPVILALFGLIFCLGITVGSIETFLLLYINEMGAKPILLGLSLLMNCVLEVPSLYFADVYMRKLGYVNCLYLACVAFGLRFLGYGLMQTPWLVLLFNTLNSITFGVMFCAAGAYGSANTPPAMHGTVQGAIQALHFGFGRGLGGIISGQIVDVYGIRTMFFIFSGISGGILVVYFAVQCFLPKQTTTHTTNEEQENTEIPGEKLNEIEALTESEPVDVTAI